MKKLEYIMTDNLRAYKKIFRNELKNVKHALCVVHIMRQFYRKGKKYHKKATSLKQQLNECKKNLRLCQKKIRIKERKLQVHQISIDILRKKLKFLRNSHCRSNKVITDLKKEINRLNSNINQPFKFKYNRIKEVHTVIQK